MKNLWKKIRNWLCKTGLCNLDKCKNEEVHKPKQESVLKRVFKIGTENCSKCGFPKKRVEGLDTCGDHAPCDK